MPVRVLLRRYGLQPYRYRGQQIVPIDGIAFQQRILRTAASATVAHAGRKFVASGPFLPWPASYSTFCPS